jgi:hypothetical protein
VVCHEHDCGRSTGLVGAVAGVHRVAALADVRTRRGGVVVDAAGWGWVGQSGFMQQCA